MKIGVLGRVNLNADRLKWVLCRNSSISLFREQDGVLIIGDVATNKNLLTTKYGLPLPT